METRGELNNGHEQLSTELLMAAFSHQKFRSNLVAMARWAGHQAESGFYVRKSNKSQPVVSRLHHSIKPVSVDDLQESLHLLVPYLYDVNVGRLDTPKSSIMCALHCHPNGILYPSTGDLEGWNEIKLGANNRFSIEGIVTVSQDTAAIFLLQEDPASEQQQHYQQWENTEPPQRLYALLDESGVRYGTLTFDLITGQFSEQELAKLAQFATA
jgi:hypothetical protein